MQLIEILENGLSAEPVGDLCDTANGVLRSTRELYGRVGFERPWVGYLACANDASDSARCVGTCAFTSPPKSGRVEIAYFTFPDFEGRGLATKMASKLLEIVRTHDPTLTVTAQTLPVKNASNSILQKLGFEFAGEVEHPEDGTVWEWKHCGSK
ncbi:MAG: hypothetical protein DHS20C16_19970 [Phycisphaerae bacterium]|nr:MAG: hypothetical protein DHS20C16_19970 [Phycisphaerae bacterium]